MSRQFWQEALWWAVTDGTAVANTTTETIVFPNVTVPANYSTPPSGASATSWR